MNGGGDSSSTVGLYGKVRSQPDFLRANAGEFSQSGLDLWFQEAMETLRTEGTQLPETPTGFLLAAAGSPWAFIGAFSPSADAASRAFPLAVFTRVALDDLIDSFPDATSLYAPFVSDAGALAFEAGGGGLAGPDCVARVQGLSVRARGAGGGIVLQDEPAQPLLEALGDSAAALGYALRTHATACDQAAKTGPGGRGGVVITVDAPAPTPAVRAFWLELARRRLRWRDAVPSLMWTDGPAGRMLITLGHASPSATAYLANPRHRASRLWPLRTDIAAAIDTAMKALTPEQRRRVENPRITLGDLISAFAP